MLIFYEKNKKILEIPNKYTILINFHNIILNMKFLICCSIITTYLIISVKSLTCDYSFVDATSLSSNTTCAEFTKATATQSMNIVKLKPCTDKEKTCNLDLTKPYIRVNKLCTYYNVKDNIKVAGEPCNHDLDCYSQDCVSSVCVGKGVNETCSDYKDCAVGLACRVKDYKRYDDKDVKVHDKYEMVCVNQIDNHHSPCDVEYDCANNMGCNGGVCVPYFSLENGEAAVSFNFCKSGYVHYDGTCRNITLVPDGTTTTSSFECVGAATSQCNYQIVNDDPKNTFPLPCECALNGNPKTGFCQRDTVNIKFQNFTKDSLNTIVTGVHTTRRFDETKKTPILFYPKFEGSVQNVTTTFTYKGNSGSYLNLALTALSLLLVILA